MMKILVVGASRGLGKAFVEGLTHDGDTIIGVSRKRPENLQPQSHAAIHWIEADMSNSVTAADVIEKHTPAELDVVIYNLGIWEERAFTREYRFLESTDEEIINLVQVNITSAILLLKRLVPRLLRASRPQIVLTGSTSGLPQSGGWEVAFGAAKFALRGISDALREGFRDQRLAVSCLQLGDLNTVDELSQPVTKACQRGGGHLIPIHDVVEITKALLHLSQCSYVKEIILPPICDTRF